MARAAIHPTSGGLVVNVIEYAPGTPYQPPAGHSLTVLPGNSPVGIGHTEDDGTFTPPPMHGLMAEPRTIPANGSTAAVVTYVDTRGNAPAQVTFTVNGATRVVHLNAGRALLDVTSVTPGDTITVTVDALPGSSVIINVTS